MAIRILAEIEALDSNGVKDGVLKLKAGDKSNVVFIELYGNFYEFNADDVIEAIRRIKGQSKTYDLLYPPGTR